jgi:hypothetical protein
MKLDELALAASRVLYKFTEGKETWTEYVDLAEALDAVVPKLSASIATTVRFRVDEFFERRF